MLYKSTRDPVGSRPQPDASLDIDFTRMRATINGVGASLESIITEGRTGTALTPGLGGILRTTPAGVPRFASNWDGSGRGLLVEGPTTNLITYSNDLSQSAWTKSTGCTITANNFMAPDATRTASLVTDTQSIGSSPGTASYSCTIPNDSSPTVVSISICPNSISKLELALSLYGGTTLVNCNATFDLQQGAVLSMTGTIYASIEPEANGFFRLQVAVSNNSSGNTTATLSISRAGASIAPGTFWAWGAQTEYAYLSATSHVLTSGATASRIADAPQLAIGSWLNISSGTIYAEADYGAQVTDESIFTIADSTGFAEGIEFLRAQSTSAFEAFVYHASTGQILLQAIGAGYYPAGSVRGALSYNTNNFIFAARTPASDYSGLMNAPLTSAGSAVPTSITNCYLGWGPTNKPLFGALKRLIFWPKFLLSQELCDLIA